MNAVRSEYTRSDWYVGFRFDPNRDNVFSQRNNEKHHIIRAKMAAGVKASFLDSHISLQTFQYSGKEVENLEFSIDQNVLALVDLIERKYLSTNSEFKPFDFAQKINYFTLDTIADLAFGNTFGDLATDSDVHQYLKTTAESLPVIIVVTVLPWLSRLFQIRFIQRLLPSEKDKLGLGRLIGYETRAVLSPGKLLKSLLL